MKVIHITRFLSLFFVILFANNGMAAPTVSGVAGTIAQNQSITVNGSSFGSHTDYHDSNQTGQLNWSWQSWRDTLENNGYSCGTTPSSAFWSLSNSSPRISGTSFARRNNTSGSNTNVAGEQRTAGVLPGFYYISYWQRIASSAFAGKISRFASSNFNSNDYWLSTAGGLGTVGSNDALICYGGSIPYTSGEWQRIDLVLDANANTQSQIIVGQNSNNNVWSGQNYSCGSQNISNLNPSTGGSFQVNMGAGLDPGVIIDFSDLYIDFTQARVEVCDSSTWAARTHCEIQVPQAWTASSLTAKVNQGSFANGSNAYLYAVDSSGNVSNGYSITFGGSGSIGLNPPTNLKILSALP